MENMLKEMNENLVEQINAYKELVSLQDEKIKCLKELNAELRYDNIKINEFILNGSKNYMDYNEQNRELQKQNEELTEENEGLQENLDVINSFYVHYRTETDEMIKALQSQVEELQVGIENARWQRSIFSAENEKMIKALQKQVEELTKENERKEKIIQNICGCLIEYK